MVECVLAAGYENDEFENLKRTGIELGITCDRADSPDELERMSCSKQYNCIFCNIIVLDSVPYINAIRKISITPIIIGSIADCENICTFNQYVQRFPQSKQDHANAIQAGKLRLCPEYRFASINEREITLTGKEFDLLALLAANPKRVFTYEMIVDLVWRENYTFYSRKTISNHISNIKKKIRVISGDHDYIVSVYGLGYKFEPDQP